MALFVAVALLALVRCTSGARSSLRGLASQPRHAGGHLELIGAKLAATSPTHAASSLVANRSTVSRITGRFTRRLGLLRSFSWFAKVRNRTNSTAVNDTAGLEMDEIEELEEETEDGLMWKCVFQIIFGVIYYFVIVWSYPYAHGNNPPEEAVEIQESNALAAVTQVSCPNVAFSCCCSVSRAAHTFDRAGLLNYWAGLFLMMIVPFCTLWGTSSFTDLNETLGGKRRNPLISCICVFFCSCCVIAQDAQALDLTAGVKTGFCGITHKESDEGSTLAATSGASDNK